VASRIQSYPPHSSACNAQAMIPTLRPNCYVADLEGTPFVEEALEGAEKIKSQSVIYGIFGDSGGS
jgi:hypothetical protein